MVSVLGWLLVAVCGLGAGVSVGGCFWFWCWGGCYWLFVVWALGAVVAQPGGGVTLAPTKPPFLVLSFAFCSAGDCGCVLP
eukprot:1646355-Pyramimonas_sp.AAC.1